MQVHETDAPADDVKHGGAARMARFHANKAGASLDTSPAHGYGEIDRSTAARGRKNRVSLLDPTREYDAPRGELLASCARVLRRMQLIGGKERHACETEIAAYLGTRRACSGPGMATDAAT